MENFENNVENVVGAEAQALPAEISIWTKMKNFLFQDVVVTMTPKQEKVLQEVHDFWHQDVNHDFWFQEIKVVDNITL